MTAFRIATPEQLEAAKVPADTDDFIAWAHSKRQDPPRCRTEYQKRKSQGEE